MWSPLRVCLLVLASSASALLIGASAPVERHPRSSARSRMMAGPGEGFNAFRRWPSSSSVCLTSSAWSHLGLDGAMHELSVPELYDCIGDEDKAEDIIKAMPMPDQRGERVLLDVDGQGSLKWTKVHA